MTTFTETLTAIKSMARITSTDRDTQLGVAINESRRALLGKDFFPQARTTGTQVLTAGTQDYSLPSDFDQFADESLRVYVTGTTNYQPIQLVQAPDADLWDSFAATYNPAAAQVIASTTPGTRKVRLMPNFTATDLTFSYVYYAYAADASGSTTIGSPAICDAIMWDVLVGDNAWTRDLKEGAMNSQYYLAKRRDAWMRARQSLLT
jgi:hypothetical protein